MSLSGRGKRLGASRRSALLFVLASLGGGAMAQVPLFRADAIVNAASFQTGPVSPGEIITLFGTQLGPDELSVLKLDASGRVATELQGVRVLFNGQAAPLVYVWESSVSAVVPYSIDGYKEIDVVVEYQGRASQAVSVGVAQAAPGLFSTNSTGRGQAAALNQDGTLNSEQNPAPIGSIVVLYGTGEGQTEPKGDDGVLAVEKLPAPLLQVGVTIDYEKAEVLYAGAAPTFVAGLLQVNARVPKTPNQGKVSVSMTVGQVKTQSGVTIYVTGF